jgi:hypothetical protein
MKLDIQVDPNFTGTLQEAQQYPSAVRLDGVCHVELEKPMKTKGLLIQFTGILKIDVRKGLTLNPDASDGKQVLCSHSYCIHGTNYLLLSVA